MDLKEYINIASLPAGARERLEAALKRLKVVLAAESEKTKEMFDTYYRFMEGKASVEEMDAANRQFKEFLRTMGLGVLVVLPFSPITIPWVVSAAKKRGIDIIPDFVKKNIKEG